MGGDLLNLIGLSTGIALYAMLLAMVVGTSRRPGGPGLDPLLLATALLGLVWNLGALPVYELLKVGVVGPLPLPTAIGFSALGFLPAVVVHSVLRRDMGHVRGRLPVAIVAVAYGASAVATLLHGVALVSRTPVPSAAAMRMLTYTFVTLAVPLAFATRGQQSARRALWAAALSIFAVSSLHLSQFHQGEPSLAVELLGHHASLPLALAILYQDFPFALADIFLKRALTLLVMVGAAFVTLVSVGGHLPVGVPPNENATGLALILTMWVGTALLYPRLRWATSWFVDHVLLHRPDYNKVRTDIATSVADSTDARTVLDDVCRQLRPALNAGSVTWESIPSDAESSPTLRPDGGTIEIPVAEHERYRLRIGGLAGGRRLLSDDCAFLESVAVLVGRRIDAIRIARERFDRERREQKMAALATQAELRALRSQVNPHFLFNALTTIGYLIQTSPPRALETLMRLTSLLRGVLRSEGEFTTLGREIDLIAAYLDIEHARFEERLRVTMQVADSLRDLRMPPLLLQPLVENAVKHGIAPERRGGELFIDARTREIDGRPQLVLTVRDTGAGVSDTDMARGRDGGVGLRNIEQRLAAQYGSAAQLSVRGVPGEGTTAVLTLPAEPADVRETAHVDACR
ncbi:MAG: histidine kinase [Vicinamibacterales bacterium]